MTYRPIAASDLDAIVRLCAAEEWPSYSRDLSTTARALTAPGVTTIVAVDGAQVVGFAQLQSDGVIQAHLSLIAVDRQHRRCGIGRRLVEEAFARCGASRLDLLSADADGFYRSFRHRTFSGFRIYPSEVPVSSSR